ncbi:tyrosine recombinase XerC [Phaeobacter gallaeciensis]|nr:tyrosine-type recombinase/integrase [Phaeobacter gallaeciensis]
MSGSMVKLGYDGLLIEPMASGNIRYRVRVRGNKNHRITLPIGPEHPEFHQIYLAARMGIIESPSDIQLQASKGTVEWLVSEYLSHIERMVSSGQASHLTLKQRQNFRPLILTRKSTSGKSEGRSWAGLPMEIPAAELAALRDDLMTTPGKAKNVFKMLKAMYKWGCERGHCQTNPAASISVHYKSQGGATPWSLDDLQKYREHHQPGTMAHMTLTLFMFTACRISDAYQLGREHEKRINGTTWLSWNPQKKGSRQIEIPVLPPLMIAIQSQKVVGSTYLLTELGRPFRSAEGLRNKFKDWCREAGLPDRSSHGIRKAAGHLLALHGATQYEIMAIHGHAQASTSQIYTESVERLKLAEMGVSKLGDLNW